MNIFIRLLLFIIALHTFPVFGQQVWVINIKGGIGPAVSDYVTREITEAQKNNAAMIILEMDTPGGLDTSMRQIIQAITVSTVPVATWVGPSGARAASAGTYILFASHIATMAPGTNLGAATPVSLGGGKPKSNPFSSEKEDKPQPSSESPPSPKDKAPSDIAEEAAKAVPASNKTSMEKKVINDAAAYIQSLAKLHGRNAQWAEKAVRQAASLDAEQALKQNVIDFIANDINQVVKQSNNTMVKLNGVETPVELNNVTFVEREQDWRFKLLSVLTNPNVAYILMLLGMYGLLLEFYSPGVGLAGVLGGICLVLAMYSLQMLPISYAGLALLVLGIMLMVAEAFSPSFGVLGLGGIVAFVVGSIMLMDTDLPGYQIAAPLIAGFTIVSVVFFFVIVTLLLKSRRRPVTTGVQILIGTQAEVVDCSKADGQYRVLVNGEVWQAKGPQSLKQGDKVTVTNVQGLWLEIEV
ncbi:NfeD family protein [Photobacterium kishitanii]|uniref:Nodulation protein NfeD n=1 Tax=Photobacterium kishitanii TaxID=318456 RepID=A0A0B7JCB2_9GAMM|nr:nodulation protein NfeD [Photobacterium kishitanii]PSU85910.1 nodulation protein NfeD [Photobacterium kishitanii]PSU88886.1 nodulation protein NfeD [Photobacterium kishitanii]PSU89989.1 nodulation protein NfeD [Photobacterium kishitanii]PSV15927.1 nodulation protein NfeD [Photobacterium kishitanii]CEO39067.1 NfeD-like family protein [Photobacterium kishitanii]